MDSKSNGSYRVEGLWRAWKIVIARCHLYMFKVGCSYTVISELWGQINGQLQSLHKFWQKFASNCSCLKMSILRRVTNWTLSKVPPSIWPHHQYRSNKIVFKKLWYVSAWLGISYLLVNDLGRLVLHEQKGWDRERWVGGENSMAMSGLGWENSSAGPFLLL